MNDNLKVSKESIDAAVQKMPVDGYESPIELFIKQEINRRKKFVENAVMTEIEKLGVHVDKKELERALIYDRQQYEIGYRNGLRAAKKFGCWQRRLVNRYGYAEEDFVCSACEKEFDGVFVRALVDQDEFSFCPNCGAQMLPITEPKPVAEGVKQ